MPVISGITEMPRCLHGLALIYVQSLYWGLSCRGTQAPLFAFLKISKAVGHTWQEGHLFFCLN